MKKIILFIFVVLLIFITTFVVFRNTESTVIINEESEKNYTEAINENINDLQEYKYEHFDPSVGMSDGKDYYEYMPSLNGIYYKKISTYQEYLLYKERWNNILEMKEEDFDNYFMVIIVPDGDSLVGTTLSELYVENNKLYIGLGLKEFKDINEFKEHKNCISIIIPNHMNRDEIEPFRTVEKYDNLISEYVDIKTLSEEYSKEQAIEDNCFVIDGVELYNKRLLDNFINDVNFKRDSYIRIVKYDDMPQGNDIAIADLQYISSKDKFILCTDYTRVSILVKGHNTYNYYEYSDLEEREGRNNGILYMLTNKKNDIPIYTYDFPICTINSSFTIIND